MNFNFFFFLILTFIFLFIFIFFVRSAMHIITCGVLSRALKKNSKPRRNCSRVHVLRANANYANLLTRNLLRLSIPRRERLEITLTSHPGTGNGENLKGCFGYVEIINFESAESYHGRIDD